MQHKNVFKYKKHCNLSGVSSVGLNRETGEVPRRWRGRELPSGWKFCLPCLSGGFSGQRGGGRNTIRVWRCSADRCSGARLWILQCVIGGGGCCCRSERCWVGGVLVVVQTVRDVAVVAFTVQFKRLPWILVIKRPWKFYQKPTLIMSQFICHWTRPVKTLETLSHAISFSIFTTFCTADRWNTSNIWAKCVFSCSIENLLSCFKHSLY